MARNDPPPPGAADDPPPGAADDPPPGAADDSRGREQGAGAGGDGATEDTLRRLHDRLDRASGAAERLIAEAAAQSAARAGNAFRRPPPAGWQAPPGGEQPGRGADLDLLVQVLESLRELIPSDLQQRLADAVRELLLALRALIDVYLDRLDGHRDEPAEVQDIPINWD